MFGTNEGAIKKAYKNAKTPTADPASIRLKTANDKEVVTALFTRQGGKGDLIGFAIENSDDYSLMSLAELSAKLGPAPAPLYTKFRTAKWVVLFWPEKEVAAAVEEGSELVIKILLLSDNSTISRKLSEQAPLVIREVVFPVRDVNVSITTKPFNRRQQDILHASLDSVAYDWLRDERRSSIYKGDSTDEIDLSVNVTTGKNRSISTSASVILHSDFGDISANGSDSTTAKDDFEVSVLTAQSVRRALNALAKSVGEQKGRKVWQAEWRPFYDLARAR